MGVKLHECGFLSYRSAHQAGKDSLEDFLNGLSLDAGSETLPDTGSGTEFATSRHRTSRK